MTKKAPRTGSWRWETKILALFLFTAVPAVAQEVAPPAHAVLRGVVVDSVRGGFLRGAEVGLLGPQRMTSTDSLGRFLIDSIQPGEYQVRLFDPLLDTLSLGVVTAPTRFAAGDTVTLILAIPSQQTIVAAKCGNLSDGGDDRALFGWVLDASTAQPIEGALITFGWVEIVTISKEAGLRTEQGSRHSESDSLGHFKLCGLPSEAAGEASVQRGAARTGKVPIVFGDALMGVVTFLLPNAGAAGPEAGQDPSAETSLGPVATASVRGVVTDTAGAPIGNAHVAVTGGRGAATTDASGTFSLDAQPPGTRALLVRRLGYLPVELAVNLTPLRASEVRVQMEHYVSMLADVVIRARRELALERVGFTRRKARGFGRYLEREYIERRYATRLSRLLEEFPELRRGSGTISGSCVVYFVDGIQWRGGDTPEEFLQPSEIHAIEAYSRVFTPVEFRVPGLNCNTVVIWTQWKLGL